MTSECFTVNGWTIWYDKYGVGPLPILMVPGGLGTGLTDYYEQLEGDDKLDQDKFTMIAVDPPGWGRSRPPARPYGQDIYNNDCNCYYQLMKHLGYDRFYYIGWSDGAIAGMTMAALYPDAIIKMASHGGVYTMFPKTLSVLKSTRDVEGWDKGRLETYLGVYKTQQEFQRLWDRHLKFCDYFTTYFPHDINLDKYSNIKFPILIMYGEKDPLSTSEHPEYFEKHIKTVKLHKIRDGKHDFHIRYSSMYKQLVEDFFEMDLTECLSIHKIMNIKTFV